MSERKIKDIVREEKLDGYVECSALANGGEKIDDVFQSAARLSLIQLGITSEPEDTTSKSENGLGCIIGWNINFFEDFDDTGEHDTFSQFNCIAKFSTDCWILDMIW